MTTNPVATAGPCQTNQIPPHHPKRFCQGPEQTSSLPAEADLEDKPANTAYNSTWATGPVVVITGAVLAVTVAGSSSLASVRRSVVSR
jgi:hypothetical protein